MCPACFQKIRPNNTIIINNQNSITTDYKNKNTLSSANIVAGYIIAILMPLIRFFCWYLYDMQKLYRAWSLCYVFQCIILVVMIFNFIYIVKQVQHG